MTKKALGVVAVLFFSAMLFLTLFAEKLHEKSLPRVIAAYPEHYSFRYEFIDENGQTDTAEITTVPRAMIDCGVFVVYSSEKNGTKRNFVRRADLQTGVEQNGYVEIVYGLAPSDKIVVECSGELYDGCEVSIIDIVSRLGQPERDLGYTVFQTVQIGSQKETRSELGARSVFYWQYFTSMCQ